MYIFFHIYIYSIKIWNERYFPRNIKFFLLKIRSIIHSNLRCKLLVFAGKYKFLDIEEITCSLRYIIFGFLCELISNYVNWTNNWPSRNVHKRQNAVFYQTEGYIVDHAVYIHIYISRISVFSRINLEYNPDYRPIQFK